MNASYRPSERRPVPARETRWAVACAGWLAAREVAPNSISIAGMTFAIAAGTAFALTGRGMPFDRVLWTTGGALVGLRLLANMLDGMVAFRSGRTSPLGDLFNEVPDRVSDFAVLAGLGYAASSSPTLGWTAAGIALFVAYVRVAAVNAGARADYRGPMAKQQRMAVVILAAAVMSATPAAWHEVSGAGAPAIALGVVGAGGLVTAWRRLVRAYGTLTSAGDGGRADGDAPAGR